MKILFYIAFMQLFLIQQVIALTFSNDSKLKKIEINYMNGSELTITNNSQSFCINKNLHPNIKKYNCKLAQEGNIYTSSRSLNSKKQHPLFIDTYLEDGAQPQITNIVTLDLDSDGENELYVQVFNRHRHKSPGASADIIELFVYDSKITPQLGTGLDVKRLYYIEEEFHKKLKSNNVSLDFTTDEEVLINTLRSVKSDNLSPKYLNSRAEIFYKNKHKYEKSNIYWYRKKQSTGYNIAVSYFEAALKKNSNYLPALSNLGIAYQKIGEYDKAIQAATRALELTTKPNQKASSHYNIAKAFEHKQDWTLALKHYEKANSYRKHKAYSKGMKRMNEKITSSN